MTVLMNVLISMGPVVEVNSFTIEDQTSYGVAIRIAGAGTRTRPFSRAVEQQELTFSLDEFAGISPGALSLQPDDDGPKWTGIWQGRSLPAEFSLEPDPDW